MDRGLHDVKVWRPVWQQKEHVECCISHIVLACGLRRLLEMQMPQASLDRYREEHGALTLVSGMSAGVPPLGS